MTLSGPALDTLAALLRPSQSGAPARARAAEVPDALWDEVIELANRHLLGPALHDALVRSGAAEGAPAEVRAYLALLHRMNLKRNAVILRQLRELVSALNGEGLAPVLLKGALVLAAPPRIGRGARMMADIDLAVPPAAARRALRVLDRTGYQLRERYPDGHHAYGEFARDGFPAAVDPHFELIDQSYVFSAAETRLRTSRIERDGIVFLTPSPTDRLLHTLLHAQIHHRGNFYAGAVMLRQLLEFADLAAMQASRIDWEFIHTRMTQHRLRTPLYSYLLLASALFDTRWPFSAPPTAAARLHAARCLVQLRHPSLRRLANPYGNLRAGFAWHRMQRMYGARGEGALAWRWRHLRHVVHEHGAGFAFHRLFHT